MKVLGWIVAIGFVAALAVFLFWVLRSFRSQPPSRDERTSFLWGRRGGGDS